MQNLEFEIEAIQIGIYTNIVLNILKHHEELSVNKILVFSYLIKKENFRLGKVYTAQNSQDVVCKAISLLAGEYEEYCENVKFILKSIHLLIVKNKIELIGELLHIVPKIEIEKSIYQESPFIGKAIEASKKVTDRQFMKEVIANV